jgi:deazaflavin-dependent oxidoreductase (nitroreductase family)
MTTTAHTPATSPTEGYPARGADRSRADDPPFMDGSWSRVDPIARAAFRQLNRRFMVPLHHAGLGEWVGTPIGGYILLLRVRGRRTGIMRETPLSYLVAEGSAWVMAGFGSRTEWFRNLLADPAVDVFLPGRRFAATAAEETDPATRARIMPALTRATGLPGFMVGLNPWTAGDEAVLAAVDRVPLVRLDPVPGPIEPGQDDPGGRAWLWRQGLLLALTAVVAWGAGRAIGALRSCLPSPAV